MAKRTAAYTVTPQIQMMFIGLAVLSVVAQIAVISYWLIRQYPSNHNLSAFLVPLVEGIVAPVVFFATAWWLRRRPGNRRAKMFDATFFAAMGILASGIITQSTIFYQSLYVFDGGYWRSVLFTLAPMAVTYLLYLVFLARYKF